MSVILQFKAEIASLASTILLVVLGYLFQARARLVWARTHSFVFLLQQQAQPAPNAQQVVPVGPATFNVYTASIYVSNLSWRVTATEVEITFNWTPPNYNIWPVRPHNTHLSPDNRFTITFPNLAPHEQFQIELISPNAQLPEVLNVRCRECVAKKIAMRPTRAFSRPATAVILLMFFLGIAAVIYLGIKLTALLA